MREGWDSQRERLQRIHTVLALAQGVNTCACMQPQERA
jgi:hypothetical protein